MLINDLSDSNSIEIVNLKIPWCLWFYRCIFRKRVSVSRIITIKLSTPTLSLNSKGYLLNAFLLGAVGSMGDQCQFGVCPSRGRPGKKTEFHWKKLQTQTPFWHCLRRSNKYLRLGLCSIYRALEFEPLIVLGICSNLQIESYILHGIYRILERQLQFYMVFAVKRNSNFAVYTQHFGVWKQKLWCCMVFVTFWSSNLFYCHVVW